MRIAYFDCFSGISGDMVLGALVDAGLPLDALEAELARLELGGYTLEAQKTSRQGIASTHLKVIEHEDGAHEAFGSNGHAPQGRTASDLERIIANSLLGEGVKAKALSAMTLLAEAEGQVHNRAPGDIHLHELSGIDTLVDIVGAIIGLEMLGVERVECSPVNVGSGCVKTAHGTLPVPAPATAEILRRASVPLYGSNVEKELVTPTGAAIVATLAAGFGPMPSMTVETLGYGAGSADIPGSPNLLRVTIGDLAAQPAPVALHPAPGSGHAIRTNDEVIALLETNLDDMNPQYYDFLMDRLLGQGALDVFLVPVQMKKNRPGVVLSVLCRPECAEALANVIFHETTTLGVRISEVPRRTLQREIVPVQTAYGPINVKVARNGDGKVLHIKPEYDDVKRAALNLNVPIDQIYEEARRAWNPQQGESHQHSGRQRTEVRSKNHDL